jgi:hypothetical protein
VKKNSEKSNMDSCSCDGGMCVLCEKGRKKITEGFKVIGEQLKSNRKTDYWVNKLYPEIAKKLGMDKEFKDGDPWWVSEYGWDKDNTWMRYHTPNYYFRIRYFNEIKEDDRVLDDIFWR